MTSKPERLIDHHLKEEDFLDRSLRPQSLDDFIGQQNVRQNLQVFVEAARNRNEPMDHLLLFGPPGLGKTTLAQIIAKELGVGFRATSGPVLSKAGDLAAILTNLQPNDVLFIDEIHRLNAVVEEILYPAMEDFRIDIIIGEGPAARSLQIDLPPFTLVAATTRSGLISAPLRDRFGIPLRLSFYTPEELSLIIKRSARLLKIKITDQGAFEIAKRSRGTPRIAGRLLRRVRDFAEVAQHLEIDEKIADAALHRLDVDAQGLDAMDRRYLTKIAQAYGGGPVGADTLAAVLSEQKDVIEDVIEPYLMQQGLIQRTPRGRILSPEGFRYIGLQPKKTQTLEMTFLHDQ